MSIKNNSNQRFLEHFFNVSHRPRTRGSLESAQDVSWFVRCLSASRLFSLSVAHKETFEEVELQVPRGDDQQAEGHRPPCDVAGVGLQQEVVCAPPHAAEAVVAEHVEDVAIHFTGGSLKMSEQIKNTSNKKKTSVFGSR